MSSEITGLNGRERATLRAVALGKAEITCSQEPDLFIDGLPVCDQFAAHRLTRQALIISCQPGNPGELVPAMLSEAGCVAIGLPPHRDVA